MAWWNDALGETIGRHLAEHWHGSGFRDTLLFPAACDRMHRRRMPTARISQTSNPQILASGVESQVNLPDADYSSRGMTDTTHQTVLTKQGIWMHCAEIHFDDKFAGDVHMRLAHTGSMTMNFESGFRSANIEHTVGTLAGLTVAEAGDVLKLYAEHTQGAPQTLDRAYLCAMWLRPLV